MTPPLAGCESPDVGATKLRKGRLAGAQIETAASTTGAVASATLEVSLAVRLDDSASARPGPATPAVARTGELAPLLLRPVVHVVGCRGNPAMMRRRSDASSTRNDTPSAAAVEHVLWARRQREARPAGAPVTGSIVTGTAQRLSMSWWSWPLGHSLGQTLPYWAVSSPTPGNDGRDDLR
jgi:hypothetical protein